MASSRSPARVHGADLHANGQLVIAAAGAGVKGNGMLPVHRPARVAREGLFERDLAFHTSQGRAETEMDSETEGNVETKVTTDVERVRVRVDAVVPTGRSRQQQHLRVRRNPLPVELDL